MPRKHWLDLAALAVLLLILSIAWRHKTESSLADTEWMPVPCALTAASCRVELPSGSSLAIQIDPTTVHPLKPFTVRAQLSGGKVAELDIRFRGEEMDMGEIRSRILADGHGEYVGQATLPVCVTGRMRWRMTVLVPDGDRLLSLPFIFVSER